MGYTVKDPVVIVTWERSGEVLLHTTLAKIIASMVGGIPHGCVIYVDGNKIYPSPGAMLSAESGEHEHH